jgi:hypothetical protein
MANLNRSFNPPGIVPPDLKTLLPRNGAARPPSLCLRRLTIVPCSPSAPPDALPARCLRAPRP